MFDYLRGQIDTRKPARVVIDVGGVGYELFIPLSTYTQLPSQGEAKVLVHYHQREDGVRLFGFKTQAERSLFRTLISISGVGPALAIQVLSAVSIQRFYEAIEAGDETFITRIKGIGKKTAQRLIVELSGKLPELETAFVVAADGHAEDVPQPTGEAGIRYDARVALETLGVTPEKAEKAIARALKELDKTGAEATADTLVRTALRFS